jgi:hypothetical protein
MEQRKAGSEFTSRTRVLGQPNLGQQMYKHEINQTVTFFGERNLKPVNLKIQAPRKEAIYRCRLFKAMPGGELEIVLDIIVYMLKLKAYFRLAPQRILHAFWSLAGFWQFRFRFAS